MTEAPSTLATDIVIIGAGPVGMSLAIDAALRDPRAPAAVDDDPAWTSA